MRRVCIFTSTRADFGLLKPVIERIQENSRLDLLILATGTHLSDEFGMTVNEILENGFDPDERINIQLVDDSPVGICNSMGMAMTRYGAALKRLHPHLCVVLGDRFETFCFAAATQVHRVPLAHIHGGELTEGAMDEAFRHSITKMSHLHFTACEEYRQRVIQLGESPNRVFNVGALGVENALNTRLMTRDELSTSIGFNLNTPYFLVTFHPVTLEPGSATKQTKALIEALTRFPNHKVIFTKSNADTEARTVNRIIDAAVAQHPNKWKAVASLGMKRYLSAVKNCAAVIGNSSSGIIEVPSFGIPTVNIGDRQKGRVRAESVVDCAPATDAIATAVQKALTPELRKRAANCINPYGKPNTSRRIIEVIESHPLTEELLKKRFHNILIHRTAGDQQ
jgi:GDP/UDP-N,N'-diacetylbacillosamine 2-epimerase (hydrolysing)